MKYFPALSVALYFLLTASGVSGIVPIAEKITPIVLDRQDFQSPDGVQLNGWIGGRITANEANRLVRIDTDRLLEGYRQRPGRQAWDGEHIGKWLHAATLAWVNTGDSALRQKLDVAVAALMKCQLEDGYLGTYMAKDRWTEWDVWAHKYNLLGLLTYVRYTGNLAPLQTCRNMADLLCRELGDGPRQRDILTAGSQHFGMASTSVLEPMALLYRFTGEKRYLEFCRYIVRAWEQPNGPRIVSHLLAHDGVNQIGNGKGYEMLSCLNGVLELYRTTGEPALLEAAKNAWQDIVDHRLYLTGAATAEETFHQDYNLPNQHNVGETCVTVTWLQLNTQLLRLTGEARFSEQLERVVMNQLFGAQRPDGAAWGYYVQMEGIKPYSDSLDGHCCLSSGPRGVALIPTFALTTDAAGLVVNLFDAGRAQLKLRDGFPVGVSIETLYPSDGKISVLLTPEAPHRFGLKLRVPAWCRHYSVRVGDTAVSPSIAADGYLVIDREWKSGDRVTLQLELSARSVLGDHGNAGRVAFFYGPLVLAADSTLLGEKGGGVTTIGFAADDVVAPKITPVAANGAFKTWPGALLFQLQGINRRTDAAGTAVTPLELQLVPFADAGCDGSAYRIWLPVNRPGTVVNLLREGQVGRSGPWRTRYDGSINDGDTGTVVDTFENKVATEAWFSVTLLESVEIHRIEFVQGSIDHDGGWFVTTKGRPKVQLQKLVGGEWETVGELADYPATDFTSAAALKSGDSFKLTLATPITARAIRVIGQPSGGDAPHQAFASCAELAAY